MHDRMMHFMYCTVVESRTSMLTLIIREVNE